jgi:hypothetical protein
MSYSQSFDFAQRALATGRRSRGSYWPVVSLWMSERGSRGGQLPRCQVGLLCDLEPQDAAAAATRFNEKV